MYRVSEPLAVPEAEGHRGGGPVGASQVLHPRRAPGWVAGVPLIRQEVHYPLIRQEVHYQRKPPTDGGAVRQGVPRRRQGYRDGAGGGQVQEGNMSSENMFGLIEIHT